MTEIAVGIVTYLPACAWRCPEVVEELRRFRPRRGDKRPRAVLVNGSPTASSMPGPAARPAGLGANTTRKSEAAPPFEGCGSSSQSTISFAVPRPKPSAPIRSLCRFTCFLLV